MSGRGTGASVGRGYDMSMYRTFCGGRRASQVGVQALLCGEEGMTGQSTGNIVGNGGYDMSGYGSCF